MPSESMQTKPVNILFYEPSTGFGGSARCLAGWLRNLDKTKFRPIVITHFDGPAISMIKNLGIETIHVPYIKIFKKFSLVMKSNTFVSYLNFFFEMIFNILPISLILIVLSKLKRIDLIDINTSIISGIPAIWASHVTKTPCVCHIHDTRKLTKKEKIVGKLVDRFIILTKHASKIYSLELPNKAMDVIYNGIDLKQWNDVKKTSKVKAEFNVGDENPVIGIVGRIARGKGQDDFIKAAKKINDINSKAKFLIVGRYVFTDYEYEQELKKLVKDLALNNHVHFTGWQEDVSRIISIFDIFVFPSSTFPEGFGLTCIEAMALGKPVIATDIPGPAEIVADKITGFLIPPSNPGILADKILELINDSSLAKKMGGAGRKRVEEIFNLENCTKQIEKLYFEVLKLGGNNNA